MSTLKKYRPVNCSDCGVECIPNSGNFKRCKPCQMRLRRQTGCGFALKNCVRCNATFKPSGSIQRFCIVCRPVARREYNIKMLEEHRRKAGAIIRGTVRPCIDCGLPYSFRSGTQKRCGPCQAKEGRRQAAEATKRSPLRGEYQKRAGKRFRDKIAFGGNKEATLARDNHACRKCGTTEKLCVHHIDGMGKGVPRDAQNHAMENLITLCLTCHSGVHAMMERLYFLRHPETARDALELFLAG